MTNDLAQKIEDSAVGLLQDEIDAMAENIRKRVEVIPDEKANQIEFALTEIPLLDPRDATLALNFLATNNVAEACKRSDIASIQIGWKILCCDRVVNFMVHQQRKRMVRLMMDADQIVLEYMRIAKAATDDGDFNTAKNCMKEISLLLGLGKTPSWDTASVKNPNGGLSVNIKFGSLEGSEEPDGEAEHRPGRGDVPGAVQSGILRQEQLPVHTDS